MNKTIDRLPSPASNQQHSSTNDNEADLQRFLGFTIGDSLNALIPLIHLQATIKISLSEILPVPQMNESLLGVINYGGKATWVADIAHLMGGSYYIGTQNSTTAMGLLFEVENETVALLIDRVGTIETFDLRQCLPIGDAMFAEPVRSFLAGYFIDYRQQLRTIIDLQQVIRSIG